MLPQNLLCALRNPSVLNPHQLAAQSFPFHLLQQTLSNLFYHINHPLVMSYIYLLDQLIKLGLGYWVEQSLLQVYVEVFVSMLRNGQERPVRELKLLRKLWVGRVSAWLLQAIRSQIYIRVGVDVEEGFTQDQSRVLAQHSQMTEANKQMQTDSNNTSCIQPEQKKIKRQREYDFNEENAKPRKVKINNSRTPKTSVREDEDISNLDTTISSDVSDNRQVETVHKKCLDILQTLRSIGKIQCKQCGVRFSSSKFYYSHLQGHLKEAKEKYQQKLNPCNPIEMYQELKENSEILSKSAKIKLKRSDFKSLQQWTEIEHEDPICTLDLYRRNYGENLSAVCFFCHKQLQVAWIKENEKWAYKDFAEFTMNGTQKKVCHLSCYTTQQEKTDS